MRYLCNCLMFVLRGSIESEIWILKVNTSGQILEYDDSTRVSMASLKRLVVETIMEKDIADLANSLV